MIRPNAPLPPTAWHTIGPFFPRTFFREGDNDLTRLSAEAAPTARGEHILLRGRVLEEGGRPCVNAVLEAWQADAAGRFRHPLDPGWREADPDFLGWGRAWTDAEGAYSFRTVMPGGYADPAGPRAPHVDLAVLASGIMRRLVTTVFFPDFPDANEADPVLRAVPEGLRHLLVARPDGRSEGLRAFRFDLLLRGAPDAETPFFVD
ncbi:MAG: protocatechuate 3,4-dioxygenase subunit alpha [Acetobacteraceae bacterium]|nr:protocatechuate 3,4-dioxygenase subunit alpha [Acetobacteraceae bacterium]MDW8398505.1 protocatechuate 3,4-dioxygenase subunit alpha [Acetobacteraceae bacterium]